MSLIQDDHVVQPFATRIAQYRLGMAATPSGLGPLGQDAPMRAHLSVSRTGQANPWPAEMLLVHTAPRASQLLARSPRREDGCPPDRWNRRHC
jgi:hypothetical protein